ncbi:hypothetical protein [Bartonella sp. LJL80]
MSDYELVLEGQDKKAYINSLQPIDIYAGFVFGRYGLGTSFLNLSLFYNKLVGTKIIFYRRIYIKCLNKIKNLTLKWARQNQHVLQKHKLTCKKSSKQPMPPDLNPEDSKADQLRHDQRIILAEAIHPLENIAYLHLIGAS